MNEEELYNHPEFKLVKRILKKEYNWIHDILLDGDPNRYDSLIFLKVRFDPWLLAEQKGFDVPFFIKKEKYTSGPLQLFYTQNFYYPPLFDLVKEIEKIPDEVHKTKALPKEYKLPKKRFSIAMFEYDPNVIQ